MSWLTFNKGRRHQSEEIQDDTIIATLKMASNSNDFVYHELITSHHTIWLSYFSTLIDKEALQTQLIEKIQQHSFQTIEELQRILARENMEVTSNGKRLSELLMRGFLAIQLNKADHACLLVPISSQVKRTISIPEVEFTVVGPKEAFVEAIDTNINLIRKRLPIPELQTQEFTLGTLSKSRVIVMYVNSIANKKNVQAMINRIADIEFDQIIDSSIVNQLIEDNSNSPFPQFIDTERPDRVAASLSEGKVAVLVDGSPTVITGPTTLVEFFGAFEDYFLSWHIATCLRFIRLAAVSFSIFATPLYVAVLTYHPEIIPQDLVQTLILSRSRIPFPPILEALFLELTIELLREAGARLPTKVGQTIGIVGGIVIGTAAVEAGLTSNVLLIIVALAALASFTTPVYRMGNTIRFIRFPFLLAAQLSGLIGLSLLFVYMLIHLLALTSLDRPYLAPLYPPRLADFKDAIFRLPFSMQHERPKQFQTKMPLRFHKRKARRKKDIDEDL